ncbi:MAG: hypothetical protein LBN08_01010 [Lactobacillales bacterium]|jgi:energy-coupling factor transport system substrate-specific component|nr:hypothetical protein [Lactobacillales bacterium]
MKNEKVRLLKIALYIIVCVFSLVITHFIPNIEIITAIILGLTAFLPLLDCLFIAVVSLLIQSLIFGLHIMTMPQIIAEYVVIIIGFFVLPSLKWLGAKAVYAGLAALITCVIISMFIAKSFGYSGFVAYGLVSYPGYLWDALANLVAYPFVWAALNYIRKKNGKLL